MSDASEVGQRDEKGITPLERDTVLQALWKELHDKFAAFISQQKLINGSKHPTALKCAGVCYYPEITLQENLLEILREIFGDEEKIKAFAKALGISFDDLMILVAANRDINLNTQEMDIRTERIHLRKEIEKRLAEKAAGTAQ
ncbi:MAG: hypothetical protein V2A63_04965 [Patescibacteria group bacterium]